MTTKLAQEPEIGFGLMIDQQGRVLDYVSRPSGARWARAFQHAHRSATDAADGFFAPQRSPI